MSHDPTSLEQDLRDLRAATLDHAFLQRLESAADGTLEQLTREEIRFEEFLRAKPAARLAPDFMAELEAAVSGVPFPVNDKIVLFPKAAPAPAAAARRNRPMWGAAAAVALIGAATALLMPGGKPADNLAANEPKTQQPAVSSAVLPSTSSGNFVPASFNRGLSEVHDEGVVYKENQPHSVVRVVYTDRVTLKHPDGRTYQVEQPKVKYVLVPARTD